MIKFITGNLFESDADAFVNTVNTEGVMGKGIALQFKKQYPNNYKEYRAKCKKGDFTIGDLLFFEEANFATGSKWIINFPTKTTWRKPSEYSYIDNGLDTLVKEIGKYTINSIAIPPLGSGNGGLDWQIVKQKIIQKLAPLDLDITVYEPNTEVKELMKKERVKLTPARAMLLFMLYKLVNNGEFVSEFSSEKLCYFLQRFGAEKYFKLNYQPNFYGPYSGVVKRVLHHLNGSYIMGYDGMDKKPFEFLSLVADGEQSVNQYLETQPELLQIAEKTDAFLTGFYSDFSLELLSTVDYISKTKNTLKKSDILIELTNWSDRKRTLFSDENFVDISIAHLKQTEFFEV